MPNLKLTVLPYFEKEDTIYFVGSDAVFSRVGAEFYID
jgi:hypothetical protein